ncbi:MAG TPA: non-homologous end-joining DNA ligase [Patescibacteria group bacterium]|nr:non-homologous end-joining DNA ligase [Patescibacteria group bacterium]
MTKKELKFTNLEKIYWPEEKYTKGDMVSYYEKIATYILPHIKGRPQSLNRFPNGISGESFFQKDMKDLPPQWAKTKKIHSDSGDKDINFIIADNKETLLYLANLGCIEINVWNSRLGSLDRPDFMVLDLDPENIEFNQVIEVAKVGKTILDKIGAVAYIKTSGSRGMHIYIPIGAKYSYEQAQQLAKLIAIAINKKIPAITSLIRSPKRRQKKVYLDYLQNGKGKTMAAPYSLRPKPGAPVSTPLEWKELRIRLDPRDFNIKNIFSRLEKKGDVWKKILKSKNNIEPLLSKLENLI